MASIMRHWVILLILSSKLNYSTAKEVGKCTFLDAQKCFQSRTVLIMGTSVSRHWFFALQNVLSTTNHPNELFVDKLGETKEHYSYRENEKVKCGGGDYSKIRLSKKVNCFSVLNETDTVVLFKWVFPFKSIDRDPIDHLLSYVSSTARDQSKSTILVNGGIEVAINTSLSMKSEVYTQLPKVIKAVSPVYDTGGTVTWRLATQLCCETSDSQGLRATSFVKGKSCFHHRTNDHSNINDVGDRLHELNQNVEEFIEVSQVPIGILDTWNMTDHSKCVEYYEDWVHHPVLAYEQIEQWMLTNLKCKCNG